MKKILQMLNKDKMLKQKPNSSTTDAGLPFALLAQNPMLAAVFCPTQTKK